jgi:repressor LexA
MHLNDHIKEYRKRAGLTLEQVAQRIGVSRQTVQRYESGVIANIPPDKIEKLATAFGIDPSVLMGWNEPKEDRNRNQANYFTFKIKNQSMEPELHENDTVFVRVQSEVKNGQLAIVKVGNEEATCKKVIRNSNGITLIGYNTVVYPPHFYSNQEIEALPVKVIGRVVEMRREY